VDAVVGNSSSGLYEAPSLHKPTVDIGERQKGRLAADSVIRCHPTRAAIGEAIARAMQADCRVVANPYGDGRSAERILRILTTDGRRDDLLKKRFHEVAAHHAGH
jgi:UDP-N-acetylglucosamine 2-epimerase